MPEQKTKPTDIPVVDFLYQIKDDQRRADCIALVKIMEKVTGHAPKMWGANIVGFGEYHYKYSSGHGGYTMLTGFSPRKANITLYAMPGDPEREAHLKKLGKHKAGVGCVYIKTLEDVDTEVLATLIKGSVNFLIKHFQSH